MEAHQLVIIEDMLLFWSIKAQDLMKIYNGQKKRQTNKFVVAVQKKVVDFICWVCYIQQSR